MSNDVKGSGGPARPVTELAPGGRAPGGTGSGGAGTPRAEALSDGIAMLRVVESALASLPVVDAARVDRIRAAVADGSYRVDARRVADKLVDFELRRGSGAQRDDRSR